MDPVTVKFIQLILAEILGVGLAIAGVTLFLRGVSGKSSLIIQGGGVKAKLLNAAPGGLVLVAGIVAVAMSLNSSVERVEHGTGDVLDEWLVNSRKVTDEMDYKEVIDTIVGTDPRVRFVNRSVRIASDSTLGGVAREEFRDEKFWPLLAAINKDVGLFTVKKARSTTPIPAGTLIEVWESSKYSGMDVRTITKVAGQDRRQAYEELLSLARSGIEFTAAEPKFTEDFKRRELEVALQSTVPSSVRTLRELSLQYYGDPKFWPLIVWTNPKEFPTDATETTPVSDRPLALVLLLSGTHVN
jgi:hypothetical protein